MKLQKVRDTQTINLVEEGYILFIIKIVEINAIHMKFEVYEVDTWECDDNHTPAESELYVEGTINSGGCSHIWFGDKDESGEQNGYLHLCGKIYWERHCELMFYISEIAETFFNKDK